MDCDCSCPAKEESRTCMDDDIPAAGYSYWMHEWPRRSDRQSGFRHANDTCGGISCYQYKPKKKWKPGGGTPDTGSEKPESEKPGSEKPDSGKTPDDGEDSPRSGTRTGTENTKSISYAYGSGSSEVTGSKTTSKSPNGGPGSSDDCLKEPKIPDWRKNWGCCDNFCERFCCKPKYQSPLDPCLALRPPWRDYLYVKGADRKKCEGERFRQRMKQYFQAKREQKLLQEGCKKKNKFKYTRFVVDEKYHVLPPLKKPETEKRPLWGPPTNQWEIDEAKGKHAYKEYKYTDWFPIPRFFQPLPKISPEVCKEDDEEYEREERPNVLTCVQTPCPRKCLRAVIRECRGRRPNRKHLHDLVKGMQDPFLKWLIEETQKVMNDFLMKKVPIIWVYGRPQKSIAEIRRKYCLSLAETHGFTYLSMDDEIALLVQRGVQAIEAGNHLFEGFKPMERLAMPLVLKLVTEKEYNMTRSETMDLIKFIMLSHHPAKGYVIDGYPWDHQDNLEFEKTFYPICCGLYFLNNQWTSYKSIPPEVIPPLYFRRGEITYDENDVEDACTQFGLKTLKIIGTETLFDDRDKVFAMHAIVDEYLDAYDEVLEGNLEALQDEGLEYETFGETKGYGVSLDDYLPKKEESEKGEEVAAEQKPEEIDPYSIKDPKKYLELNPLKEKKFESVGLDRFTPSEFDMDNLKITPSKKRFSEAKEKQPEEKACAEDDEECKKKKRRRRHRCRCRCRCHRRHRRSGNEYDGDHDYLPGSIPRSPGGRAFSGRPDDGYGDYDDDYSPRGYDTSPYDRSRPRRSGPRGWPPNQNGRFMGGDSSAPDEDMGKEGPLVYDPKWGFVSTRRAGKHPEIHLPRLETPNLNTDPLKKQAEEEEKAKELGGVYALPPKKAHNIPDPYNTIPHKRGDKPGDYLQDYPGSNAPDRFSKINRQEVPPEDERVPTSTTPNTTEPTAGLRSMFSDTMARTMAKNQADIRKIKYDKLKKKVAQVEYEIYQDDYRLPKYRFYKKYKDYTPEDFIREQKNWIPCRGCFDNFKEADEYFKKDTPAHLSLAKLTHDKYEAAEELEHQQRNRPLFDRLVACLCGDDKAGLHIPGYKKEEELEDNADLEKMDELSDYREKKEIPT